MALTAMSTDANLSQRRRKPSTYGRLSQRTIDGHAYVFGVNEVPSLADRSRLAKPAAEAAYCNPSSKTISANADVFDYTSSDNSPPLRPSITIPHYSSTHHAENVPKVDIFDVPLSDEEVTPVSKAGHSVKTSTFTTTKSSTRTNVRRQRPQLLQPLHNTSQTSSSKVSIHITKRRRVSTSPDSTRRTLKNRSGQKSMEVDVRQLDPKCYSETAMTSENPRLGCDAELNQLEVFSTTNFRKLDQTCSSRENTLRKPISSAISAPAILNAMMEGARHHCKPLESLATQVPCPRTPEKSKITQDLMPSQPLSQNVISHSTPSPQGSRLVSTSRQAKIWGSLFQPDSINLVTSKSSCETSSKQPSVTTSHPKKRLIDTLGAFADDACASDDSHLGEIASITKLTVEQQPGGFRAALNGDSSSCSPTISASRAQAKITYGGQHSFLDDSGNGIESLLTMSSDFRPAHTSTVLENSERIKVHGHVTHKSMSDEEDSVNTMKSIHELRASGDSIRFENDLSIEDFEVLGKSSISRKRNAILQICSRLSDVNFRDRFTQYGLELRIMVASRDESDLVVGTALATMLTYTLALSSSLRTTQQLYAAGAVKFLSRLLEEERDIVTVAKSRASNMSKVAQNSVAIFKSQLLGSPLWTEDCIATLSPMIVALKSLDLLVRRLRKEKVKDPILTTELLNLLLRILNTVLRKRYNDKNAVEQLDVVILRSVLSMLESFTIVESCALNTSLWNADTLTELVDGLDAVMGQPAFQAHGFGPLISRICLNLSNNAEENTTPFSKSTFIAKLMSQVNIGLEALRHGQVGEESTGDFENLVLALGAMFNLAEWSDCARLVIFRNCREDLDGLIDAFIDSRSRASKAESLAASSANVAYGYLAVLLGHLCQNVEVRGHIRAKLPGMSLSTLSAAVEEFILHHREADKGQESNEAWVAFTHRLVVVAEGLKRMCIET